MELKEVKKENEDEKILNRYFNIINNFNSDSILIINQIKDKLDLINPVASLKEAEQSPSIKDNCFLSRLDELSGQSNYILNELSEIHRRLNELI